MESVLQFIVFLKMVRSKFLTLDPTKLDTTIWPPRTTNGGNIVVVFQPKAFNYQHNPITIQLLKQ